MAPGAAHLPLLELEPGIVSEFIVPRLQRHQQAALSLTCKALRRAVADGVREVSTWHCMQAVGTWWSLHSPFVVLSLSRMQYLRVSSVAVGALLRREPRSR